MKPRKVLDKVLSGSKNIRFDDFIGLVEACGFMQERISGSHHIFSHPDVPQTISIQPGKHHQAKPYQFRQFLRLMEKYELTLMSGSEDDESGKEGEQS